MSSNFVKSALDGIRILDLTRVLAGPLCTMLLGDLGADVIKIEPPGRGDDTRHWGPPWLSGDPPLSAYFVSVNRNKRSVTVDFTTAEGQELIHGLVKSSAILVENFRPGKLAEYGLDFEALSRLNPGLVYCSISGFGQDGPYRDRPGYDAVIQAMSGLMSITGPADGAPHKVGVAISDVLTGLYASHAVLAALRHAERTGAGQHLDVALLDVQLASLVNVASGFLCTGRPPGRYGNQHANIVPYQTFTAVDGEFMVAVGNDGQFAQLCEILGAPALASDPRFSRNPARVENRSELLSILQKHFRSQTVNHWVDRLLEQGIPAGPILAVNEILEDRHVVARNMVQSVAEIPMVSNPGKWSVTPPQIRRAPPQLGADTEEVLKELLGLDSGTILDYRARGIL